MRTRAATVLYLSTAFALTLLEHILHQHRKMWSRLQQLSMPHVLPSVTVRWTSLTSLVRCSTARRLLRRMSLVRV
jgi:hypothetical protein